MPDEIEPADGGQLQPPPQWMEQWLHNQAREIQVRSDELALAKQQDQHAHEYANASLAAQAADLREEREYNTGALKFLGKITVALVFIILAFFATLMLTGHEQAALELAKILIYGGVGAAGGYGIGKGKKNGAANE